MTDGLARAVREASDKAYDEMLNCWFGHHDYSDEQRSDAVVEIVLAHVGPPFEAQAAAHAEVCKRIEERLGVEKFVPGIWLCDTCQFVIHKRLIHPETFTVSVDNQERQELCPNDGTPMRRMSWEEYADSQDASIKELALKRRELEQREWRLREALADLLSDYGGRGRFYDAALDALAEDGDE